GTSSAVLTDKSDSFRLPWHLVPCSVSGGDTMKSLCLNQWIRIASLTLVTLAFCAIWTQAQSQDTQTPDLQQLKDKLQHMARAGRDSRNSWCTARAPATPQTDGRAGNRLPRRQSNARAGLTRHPRLGRIGRQDSLSRRRRRHFAYNHADPRRLGKSGGRSNHESAKHARRLLRRHGLSHESECAESRHASGGDGPSGEVSAPDDPRLRICRALRAADL